MAKRITPRDLDILQTLGLARFVPTPALEWLHFEGWRERWAQYLAALDQGADAPYKPTSQLYRRLKLLREHGLVHAITRPVDLSLSAFTRDTNVYALSREGADLVAASTDIDRETLSYDQPRERSFLTLAHSATIGTCYAALRAKLETMPGVSLEGWRGDHQLARAYDRLSVKIPVQGGATRVEQLPVLPDATFVIRSSGGAIRFFLEVDRGRPIESWRKKIRAYEAYAKSPALQARYGVESFIVLAATTTRRQRLSLMDATTQVTSGPSDRYLFTLIDDLHPLSIGAWWKIATAVPVTKRTGFGRQHTAYQVEETQHTLLR